MEKKFFSIFYTLQGIGNLAFALWFFMNPPFGIIFGSLLLPATVLSLVAVLYLLRRDEETALSLGIVSSLLFTLYYGWMAANIWNSVTRSDENMQGFTTFQAYFLLLSIVIVELNVISIFLLYKSKKNKSI